MLSTIMCWNATYFCANAGDDVFVCMGVCASARTRMYASCDMRQVRAHAELCTHPIKSVSILHFIECTLMDDDNPCIGCNAIFD